MIKQLISFLLPILNIILIPYLIVGNFIDATANNTSEVMLMIGAIVVVAGLFILISTIRTFILIGKGTLAPWSPTSNLVIGGMYSYVRNPMISGVLFILIGESLLFHSWGVFVWAIVFFIINHVYFLLSEEPGLHKRFGDDYQTYKANVPRWIPRFKPWGRHKNR